MKEVKSSDNVMIAYEESGQGPALVIVGGSLADHYMYQPLALELANHFTVFNYDRRNRGMSGRSQHHNVEAELDDLKALMSIAQGPKILYGHSAGAALAIRAAAKGMEIDGLILADLPFSILDDNRTEAIESHNDEYNEIERLINEGDQEGAVRYFLKDFGMSEDELDVFIASEGGQARVKISPTLLVDYKILGNGVTPAELLKEISAPTLILTSEFGLPAARDVAKYLSDGHIKMLDSPAHITSPKDIAEAVIGFYKR